LILKIKKEKKKSLIVDLKNKIIIKTNDELKTTGKEASRNKSNGAAN
jgi:hypothetical protein